MATQERVKELLDYDPSTGVFTRKVSVARRVKAREGQIAGSVNQRGYLRIMIDGKSYLSHRLAFLYMEGSIPKVVDHINGIKDDNRWENLRSANQSINCKNMSMNSKNTSGKMGVTWDKRTGSWTARISVNNKKVWLGRYANHDDAVSAREAAEIKYGYSKRHGELK